MKEEKIVFICELPPPFGGVTIKDKLLLQSVMDSETVEVIDLYECKRKPIRTVGIAWRMFWAYKRNVRIVYGLGSCRRLEIANWIQRMIGGRNSIDNTIVFVMGASLPEYLSEKGRYADLLRHMRKLYVETERLRDALLTYGIKNIDIFPNARSSKGSIPPKKRGEGDPLKCVFFSKICEEKGVMEIVKMYELLEKHQRDGLQLDFYGHISESIQDNFAAFLKRSGNVRYCGVFDAAASNLYAKLSEYDILLFPTLWKREGIPGILVEAKMAGIVPVVSDINYNAEVVIDGKEGIVLSKNYAENLRKAIIRLMNDAELLYQLKMGSYASRNRYAIENYKNILKKVIQVSE